MRAILTYHSIDPSGSAISVTPEEFRRHVRWLAAGRVRVVSLAELVQLPPAADAVALTFDDAFSNFADEAAPVLAEHGLPSTLFVVPKHVGGRNTWGGRSDPRVPTLPLMGWDELNRLAAGGLVRLGAHTQTHPHLTRVSVDQLIEELAGAAEAIQKESGTLPDDLAYPYGDVSPAVADRARDLYRRGVTTELSPLRREEDPLLLPRLDMFYLRAPGRLEAWGSSRFAGRLWMRAQARRMRASLAGDRGAW